MFLRSLRPFVFQFSLRLCSSALKFFSPNFRTMNRDKELRPTFNFPLLTFNSERTPRADSIRRSPRGITSLHKIGRGIGMSATRHVPLDTVFAVMVPLAGRCEMQKNGHRCG
jgi:hypothetical protein